MKDDSLYVEQMLDATRKIREFTSGVDEEFKNHVSLPWNEIAGFRNRAIHEYLSLDIDDVWNTVQNDIPVLEKALEKSIV